MSNEYRQTFSKGVGAITKAELIERFNYNSSTLLVCEFIDYGDIPSPP